MAMYSRTHVVRELQTLTGCCLTLPFRVPYFKETLKGPFSATSRPMFASQSSSYNIFHDLQDVYSFESLQTFRNLENVRQALVKLS